MALAINTNTLSLAAQNNLNQSQKSLNSAIERLSSGSKINSAKDDAAGQAIANRLTSQITGLKQASSNANDGISLAQTTEGALDQVNDNLQRIRQLTVQAGNGTNSSSDLDSIQGEITQRLAEIDRVSEQTSFNGTKVLDGSKTSIDIQVGSQDGETISIALQKVDSAALSLDGFTVAGTDDGDGNITGQTADPLTALDAAIKQVDGVRSNLGAVQNRLDSAITNISSTNVNLSSARSRIEDADYATEVSNLSKAQILQQAGTSVLAQANQTGQGVLSLLR